VDDALHRDVRDPGHQWVGVQQAVVVVHRRHRGVRSFKGERVGN